MNRAVPDNKLRRTLQNQEDTPRVVCVYGDEVPEVPSETRCEVCGRVIPLRYVTIGYDINMKPDDLK